MAQLVGKTISGCFAPAAAPAGVKTLPFSVIPPEPGMSWNVRRWALALAGAVPGAAVAAGAAASAAPASRATAVVIEAVVRSAGFGRATGSLLTRVSAK